MPSTNVDVILRARDEATSQIQKMASALSGLGTVASRLNVVMGLAVSGFAAAAGFATKLAADVEQLDNLSASSGVSARNLQVLQFAFKQGGVDAAALTQGLNFLNRAIASNDPVLAKLGVTSGDTFEAFMQAAMGLQTIANDAERAKLTYDMFGRGGAQLIPVLLQLAGGFDSVSAAAERTGNVLSETDLEKMREIDAQFDKMSAVFEGFGKRVAVAVGGPLADFLKWLEDVAKFSKDPFIRALFGGGAGGEGDPKIRTGGVGDAMMAGVMVSAKRVNPINLGSFASSAEGATFGLRGTSGPTLEHLKNMMKVDPVVEEAKLKFTEFAAHLERVAATIQQVFRTVGDALSFGIVEVFVNLTNKAQTFSSAIQNIFRHMVQGVLQAIGEIVAAQVTKAFIKILGAVVGFFIGGPTGAAIGSGLGGGFDSPVPSMGLTAGGGAASAAMGGGNTFIIQTINARDTLQSLLSPTGSMRTANSRLREVAAAS